MMDLINPLLNAVTSLHGEALIIFILIVNGYLFKMVPMFPNKWIPLVNLLLAPMLCVLCVRWPDANDTWMQNVKYPALAAWANTIMQGVALDFVAWAIHRKVLKSLIDEKVPALTPGLTKEKKQVVESTVDSGGETKVIENIEKTTVASPPEAGLATDKEMKT